MKDRIKEINYLIYLKSQLIKNTKKEIENLQEEKKSIEGSKRLEKTKCIRGK